MDEFDANKASSSVNGMNTEDQASRENLMEEGVSGVNAEGQSKPPGGAVSKTPRQPGLVDLIGDQVIQQLRTPRSPKTPKQQKMAQTETQAKQRPANRTYRTRTISRKMKVNQCRKCEYLINERYHCTICENYDLCPTCKEEVKHPHKMVKLVDKPPQEARKLSIQRCIQSLVHACQCKNADCRLASCQRMKRVVQHMKICKRRTSDGCPICKQVVALCCHHARNCVEDNCPVPFCFSIKQKVTSQADRQRIQEAQLLRLRMVVTNARPSELSNLFARASCPESSPPILSSDAAEAYQTWRQIGKKTDEKPANASVQSNSSSPTHSKEKLGLNKCILFKKKGLLAGPQKKKLAVLAKKLNTEISGSSTTDFRSDTD